MGGENRTYRGAVERQPVEVERRRRAGGRQAGRGREHSRRPPVTDVGGKWHDVMHSVNGSGVGMYKGCTTGRVRVMSAGASRTMLDSTVADVPGPPVNASHCDCDDSDFTTVPFGMHGPRVWTTVEGRSDAVAVTVVGYCSTHVDTHSHRPCFGPIHESSISSVRSQ